MNKIIAGVCALTVATWGFAAVTGANAEPAHPPATEHCEKDGHHGGHLSSNHDCEHKPASH